MIKFVFKMSTDPLVLIQIVNEMLIQQIERSNEMNFCYLHEQKEIFYWNNTNIDLNPRYRV